MVWYGMVWYSTVTQGEIQRETFEKDVKGRPSVSISLAVVLVISSFLTFSSSAAHSPRGQLFARLSSCPAWHLLRPYQIWNSRRHTPAHPRREPQKWPSPIIIFPSSSTAGCNRPSSFPSQQRATSRIPNLSLILRCPFLPTRMTGAPKVGLYGTPKGHIVRSLVVDERPRHLLLHQAFSHDKDGIAGHIPTMYDWRSEARQYRRYRGNKDPRSMLLLSMDCNGRT
ncbi:hypothetical protein LY78DRAFT_71484 [Colletotrichum sublineola]|nr:hypothetical protein LY78DRAFT_71484 [Colletotrichum sublineola]